MNIKKGAIGYAPCWPFKVQWDGGEWQSQMGPITEWFWHYVVSMLWDGCVIVHEEDILK